MIEIKYSDGCGHLVGLSEFVRKLNPWFTTLVYISIMHSYQPSIKSPLKESWKIRLQMIWDHLSCFYVSWLPYCSENCHLPWGVYSVPKKHPLVHVNLLNFGLKTVIEIWSFSERSCQRSTHRLHKILSSWNPQFCKQLQL